MDAKRRFRVPGEVLSALGWLEGGERQELLAEIVGEGHLRLRREPDVLPWLERIEADLRANEDDSEEQRQAADEEQRALWDRFRPAVLYKDSRIDLTSPVMAALDPNGAAESLYVELGLRCIEIYTSAGRLRRIEQSRRRLPFQPTE